MFKTKSKFIIIFLILVLLFSTTFVCATDEPTEYDVMPISIDETVNPNAKSIDPTVNPNTKTAEKTYEEGDVYLANKESVSIDYIVDGNLFAIADTVTINSQIGGDAFILANKLVIDENAYVFNNVFVIADTIEINGVVSDVFCIGQNLTVSGHIYRDLKVSCNTLNVNGIVGRNAFVSCENLNFNTEPESNGVIYGNLDYSANSEQSIPDTSVNGAITYSPISNKTQASVQSVIADYILDLGTFLVFILIIWLMCLCIAPKFLNNTNNFVGKSSLKVLGIGLLTLVLVPILSIILLFVQLTSTVSLLLLALYTLALVISTSLFTITTNNYVCSKLKINKNLGIFGMLIVTGIVVWAITKVPYIGGLISFAITVLGLGILVSSLIPKSFKKNLKEEMI